MVFNGLLKMKIHLLLYIVELWKCYNFFHIYVHTCINMVSKIELYRNAYDVSCSGKYFIIIIIPKKRLSCGFSKNIQRKLKFLLYESLWYYFRCKPHRLLMSVEIFCWQEHVFKWFIMLIYAVVTIFFYVLKQTRSDVLWPHIYYHYYYLFFIFMFHWKVMKNNLWNKRSGKSSGLWHMENGLPQIVQKIKVGKVWKVGKTFIK